MRVIHSTHPVYCLLWIYATDACYEYRIQKNLAASDKLVKRVLAGSVNSQRSTVSICISFVYTESISIFYVALSSLRRYDPAILTIWQRAEHIITINYSHLEKEVIKR
uniref:SFRICE_029521 n=1 Tax=Spodoptera frugiperda TaxID=7108 RepID=A0A2H1V1T4_SPOFR